MKTRREDQLGIIYAIVAAFAAASYIVINRHVYLQYKVDGFAYTVTFLACAGGFALLNLLLHNSIKTLAKDPGQSGRLVWNGLIASMALVLFTVGQQYTTAVNASIIFTLTTFTTLAYSRVMLKERFDQRQLAWVAVLFIGLYFAVVGTHLLSFNRGDLLVLASVFFLGFSNTYSKILMRHSSSDSVADVRLLTGLVLFSLIGLATKGTGFLITSAGFWPVLAGFGLWLTIKMFYAAVRRISLGKAAVLVNSHPVITPILGVFLLSEPYDIIKFAGSAVMLISVYNITKR